jgi:hypothetical protein
VAELRALPSSFSRRATEAQRFVGWQTWDESESRSKGIPAVSAAHIAFRPSLSPPVFLERGPATQGPGLHPVDRCAAGNRVSKTHVMNIGKADVAKQRLSAYGRLRAGRNTGHRGGGPDPLSSVRLDRWGPVTIATSGSFRTPANAGRVARDRLGGDGSRLRETTDRAVSQAARRHEAVREPDRLIGWV